MKNSIYILAIVFMTYGNASAISVNFLNELELDSTEKIVHPFGENTQATDKTLRTNERYFENYFCEVPSKICLDTSYFISEVSKKHAHCAKLFFSHEELKAFGIQANFVASNNDLKKRANGALLDSSILRTPPQSLKFKGLENLNLDNYFSQPINPSYSKGFGIRFSI